MMKEVVNQKGREKFYVLCLEVCGCYPLREFVVDYRMMRSRGYCWSCGCLSDFVLGITVGVWRGVQTLE